MQTSHLIDHFRYFAGATRSREGSSTEIDKDTIAYHFHETLGVVGQIIPFNFPLPMAAWKIAPALAAGNCTVIKPALPTPWSISNPSPGIALGLKATKRPWRRHSDATR